MNEYYVYLYLRESDGTPYYIGKGKGKRYKKNHRHINIPPNEDNIVFVKKNMTNEEACLLEIELISKYGRKDLGTGNLLNQTCGGDGGDTSKSEGYQKFYEEKMLNKDSDYIKNLSERMKENNPMWRQDVYDKCHNPEVYAKISEALKGKTKSEDHKQKLREALLLQSEEISKRTSDLWENEEYKSKVSMGMYEKIDQLKNMSEDEFYEWISDKNLLSYDTVRKYERPNARVFSIVKHFGKVEEFYSEYFDRQKIENEKKRSPCQYYKNSSDQEFREWIKTQKLYRKDGNPNSKVMGVIRYRGLMSEFYPNYQKN